MPLSIDTNNQFVYSHTATQAGTHRITLDTENTFIDKNIAINMITPSGTIESGSSTAVAVINNTDDTNATNIHGIISSITSQPTNNSVYYIALDVTGGGIPSVTKSGWIDINNTLPNSTTTVTKYFSVTKATTNITNNASVTNTLAIQESNVTFGSSNNGISISITASATASGSITATISRAGYAPLNDSTTGSIAANKSTSTTKYITGVTVPSTTFTAVAASNTAGTIKITAYANSTSSTTAQAVVVKNGVWSTTAIDPSTNALGPYYGKVSVNKISSSSLSAANIKQGVVVTVDGGSSNIYTVTGTFTSDGTVTNNSQILSGYIAYSKGQRYTGNMANNGAINYTITTQNGKYTIPAGYTSGGTITATLPTTTVTRPSWTINSSNVLTSSSAHWSAGYLSDAGSITAVKFYNSPQSGITYLDITNALTTTANNGEYYLPEVTGTRYIYINRGYIDNVSIDIGRFIPDITTANAGAEANHILKDKYAYDGEGNLLHGTIPSIAATTYTPTTSNQTINSGNYLSGNQVIKGDANLKASEIKSGTTIFGVAGVFSHTSTITGSKTAVTAASLRSGYAAFINGSQINGTMPNTSASTTFTATNIGTYFSTTSGSGSISIVPKYTITTAGYIATTADKAGTTLYYNIRTTSLTAKSGAVALTSNTTAPNGSAPFSIYSSSTTRNIKITSTTSDVGNNRVYIEVKGTGSVAASTTGWISSTAATSSTTAVHYISMALYTGGYSTSDE